MVPDLKEIHSLTNLNKVRQRTSLLKAREMIDKQYQHYRAAIVSSGY